MVVLNYTGEEINAKIVYYGPGLSGKTTNLESLYGQMPDDSKGQMVSMKTRTDRTLFFDFFPLELGEINGYRARFLLYTVPGQVYYNATRKLVLKGADAVVFIADSDPSKLQENIDSLRNLEDNLNEHGLSLDTIPWIIQYNKRDLPDASPVATLHQHLNLLNVPAFEAVANTGQGVHETFKSIADILYEKLREKLESGEAISTAAGDDMPGLPAGAAAEPKDVTETLDSVLREVDTVPVPSSGPSHIESGHSLVPQQPVPPAPVTPPPSAAPPVTAQETAPPVTPQVTAPHTMHQMQSRSQSRSQTVDSSRDATQSVDTQPQAGPNPPEHSPTTPVEPAAPIKTVPATPPAAKQAYPTPVSPVPQPPVTPEAAENSPGPVNTPVSQPRSQNVDSSRDVPNSGTSQIVNSGSSASQQAPEKAPAPAADDPAIVAVAEPTRPQPNHNSQSMSQPWERPHPPADKPAMEKGPDTSRETQDDPSVEGLSNPSLNLGGGEEEEAPDIGRLVELDESNDSTDSPETEKTPEFITDPMSRGAVAEEEPEIQAYEAPKVADPKPVDKEQELVVPVVISRSQVNKTIPLKLRLEIQVIDD